MKFAFHMKREAERFVCLMAALVVMLDVVIASSAEEEGEKQCK